MTTFAAEYIIMRSRGMLDNARRMTSFQFILTPDRYRLLLLSAEFSPLHTGPVSFEIFCHGQRADIRAHVI